MKNKIFINIPCNTSEKIYYELKVESEHPATIKIIFYDHHNELLNTILVEKSTSNIQRQGVVILDDKPALIEIYMQGIKGDLVTGSITIRYSYVDFNTLLILIGVNVITALAGTSLLLYCIYHHVMYRALALRKARQIKHSCPPPFMSNFILL